MDILTVGPTGGIKLPNSVRERYAMATATPIRFIETRSGILLMPLTNAPMNTDLAEELADWQALSAQTWQSFPYDAD